MKKYLLGILIGFIFAASLVSAFYQGVANECVLRGYDSALVGSMGAVCVNVRDLERDDFRMTVGSF